MYQPSHQSHDHSDNALLFGQSQRENGELDKIFFSVHQLKCLMLKLWAYDVEHHLLSLLLTAWQMSHSQIPHESTNHKTQMEWLPGCWAVTHRYPPFLGISGFRPCANRLWQRDLKSQTAGQLGCQQTQSSQRLDRTDMSWGRVLQTGIGRGKRFSVHCPVGLEFRISIDAVKVLALHSKSWSQVKEEWKATS